MWSKFKYYISSAKPRFIIILMLAGIFLGGLIYTLSLKTETLPPAVIRIEIDEAWYPLKLHNKEKYVSAYSEDLLRKIAAQQHISVQIDRSGSENRLAGLDNGEYEGILSSLILQEENTEKYISSNPYYLFGPVLIVKNNPESIKLIEHFNEGLKAIKKNDIYNQLLLKWELVDPEKL